MPLAGRRRGRRREPILRRRDWALPPPPVEREVVAALPGEPDPDRPPLLFVHGAAMGAWAWERWLPAVAEAGWAGHALSLRGHGGSERPERFHLTPLRHYEHDVLQVITGLPAPPVLVGHSLGAVVVLRVLERYRAAPAGVLVAPVPPGRVLELTGSLLRHDPAALVGTATGWRPPPAASTLFGPATDPDEATRMRRRLGTASLVAGVQATLPPRVRDVRCPLLVLGGGDDRVVPPHAIVRLAGDHGTRAHLFRGMGHLLMLEPGWRVPLDLLLRWLDRVVAAR